ncbi:hypothetical protein LSUE1_G000691 [Lachnellula suecica]|uniref:Transcription initiation factor TFIID subunit 4 n=1 Tax=Lachnellula suecica TaxID=602035 RepID=A0A8T9CK25_9HELO|nr:hypothetical protein LSUE1_G000691 [Lachnellula suecica]
MAQQPQQQQYPMPQPPRAFSPNQSATATSPGAPQQFPFPPNKRQRLSPNPGSQPTSPYVQSPYAMSPGTAGPPSAGASPHTFSNVQLPPNVYNTPYANGHTTPTLNLPQQPPIHRNPQQQQPQQNQQPNPLNFPNQHQANMHHNFNNYSMAPHGTGSMGPPSKPVEKAKEDSMDVMDVLGGTGINIQEEEQYMYTQSFGSQLSTSQSGTISSGHSFTQFAPGDERSFYGAGPANGAAEPTNGKSQEDLAAEAAEAAWNGAARRIAESRQSELHNSFLTTPLLQMKMDKVAKEHGLGLKRGVNHSMGQMFLPGQFPDPTVRVQTAVGPNGAITTTNGSFLPTDTQLVDLIALMSLASKHRMRVLVEEASRLAKSRLTGSHGVIPEEWADAAAPASLSGAVAEGDLRGGWESAVSPHSNPLKRSYSSANKFPTPVSDVSKAEGGLKFTNEVVAALRTSAVKERADEEARLKKRNARANGETPRSGSIVPGTPGSIAPEVPEKGTLKKDNKKKESAKATEEASHKAANATTTQFLGGGKGLFGKKKKYDWMTASASGASTPHRISTSGIAGTPVTPAPEKLTLEAARRLGSWREDSAKGQGIQLRDWIAVLEDDGHEKMALQKAYMSIDASEPK